MATESLRKIGFVKINGIKIPVITSITFKDDNERGQEYEVNFQNTVTQDQGPEGGDTADRTVTYSWVCSTDQRGKYWDKENIDPHSNSPVAACVLVERVQKWKDFDAQDRGQETWTSIDNISLDKDGPPFFITHQKTHCVKYYSGTTDDDGNWNKLDGDWVMMELIDELSVIYERGQERTYILLNPRDDEEANNIIDQQNDDGTPEIDQSGLAFVVDDSDDPWHVPNQAIRLDPFQNLVKLKPFVYYPAISVNQGYQISSIGTIITLDNYFAYYFGLGDPDGGMTRVTLPDGTTSPPPGYEISQYFSGPGPGFETPATLSALRDGNYEQLMAAGASSITGLKPSANPAMSAQVHYMIDPLNRTFFQGSVSGHTIKANLSYDTTGNFTVFHAEALFTPNGFVGGGTWYRGIRMGGGEVGEQSTDFDSIIVVWPKYNTSTKETVTFDSIYGPSFNPGDQNSPVFGQEEISAQATIYSSEYGYIDIPPAS